MALQLDEKSATTYFNLALALLEQRKLDGAIANYRAAITCEPDYLEAHCNLGVALKEKGKLDEALVSYLAALAINPHWVHALYNIGILYGLKKQFAQAEQWYRKVLTVAPDFISAHVNLANILHDDGRVEEAQHHHDAAYRKQCVFPIPSPSAARTVLILLDSTNGNVPTQFLFPTAENKQVKCVNRIEWMIEYATEDQHRHLPPYDLVFNAIGDADVTDKSAPQVERFLGQCSKPVLNSPAAVARTARHLMRQLFSDLDVVIPNVWRVEQSGDWFANSEFSFPILVRPLVSHGGKGLVLAKDREELANAKTARCKEVYLTAFHDYRSADGYFRKYRIFFIDRKPYPYHLAISEHWLVHYDTADMTASWKLAEEKLFLSDPDAVLGTDAMNLIKAIGQRLDLDYCGVDF
jgi:hypothetical protein